MSEPPPKPAQAKHPLPKRVNVVVLDLHKLTKGFYNAGWWQALRQHAHIVESSAFEDERSLLRPVLDWATGDSYRLQSVDYDMAAVKGAAATYCNQMLDRFLWLWTSGKEQAAYQYAAQMDARRQRAETAVRDRFRRADAKNRQVARRAEITATWLSNVKVGCTVAVVVGVCVVTLGAGLPAVTLLGTQVGLGSAGGATLLGLGFSGAQILVEQDKAKKAQALAILGTVQGADKIAHKKIHADMHVAERKMIEATKEYQRAGRKVAKAQRELGRNLSRSARQSASDRLSHWGQVKADAPAKKAAALKQLSKLKLAGKAVPVVAMLPDLYVAIRDWREEQAALAH